MARLRWRADLHAGEVLLVHGAGGGVGLTAVECGKAMGATVIATARGADKLAVAREHGADHVARQRRPPTSRRTIRELTAGRGAGRRLRSGRRADVRASLRSIAWEGRIVIIGFASGDVPQIPANLLLVKNASVLGFYWGSYRKHDPERLRRRISRAVRLVSAGPDPAARLATACRWAGGRGGAAADLAAKHRQGGADHGREDVRSRRRRSPRMVVVQGDITEQAVDAIVNAANSACWAGAGSTARSTARPGPSSWRNAGRSAAAPPAMPG